jgi:hypothetical protein
MKLHYPILTQIVDRRHVSESIDKVIAYAISRLDAMPTKDQEHFIADCKKIHRENQKLYIQVMRGII